LDVSFAFLCDYADQTGGKMAAIGVGFDTIYARTIPASHPLFFAVIALRFSTTEVGPKQVGIRIIDADGSNIVPPVDTTINVEPPPAGYLFRTQRIALALHGVTFNRYGDYAISWLVGGQEVKQVALKVAPPPALPGTA